MIAIIERMVLVLQTQGGKMTCSVQHVVLDQVDFMHAGVTMRQALTEFRYA